ncbi:MAG: hypothetical protein H6595_12980 [Flavobacteriales bacterium]|nr:hypothetical protein [Flavobacteriales bacterium]MCB9168378.1 hypothetical protein [Flavobacteriales bacterium]
MGEAIENWDDFRAMLRGKVFLVGVDLLSGDGALIEKYQTAGVVEELTNDGFFLLKREDGSLFTLPYEPTSIKVADKGEYTLKATNEVIVDPDYMTTWDVKLKSADDMADFKAKGFKR